MHPRQEEAQQGKRKGEDGMAELDQGEVGFHAGRFDTGRAVVKVFRRFRLKNKTKKERLFF